MNKLIITISWILLLVSCNAQNQNNSLTESQDIDSTPPFFYGMPEVVLAQDTSEGWQQKGQKILITGIVYKSNGKIPAPNTLIYYYHTDTKGKYKHIEEVERSLPPNSMGLTHGHLRGWVKTDENGKYSIYTIRPGTYPSRDEPAHIHVSIKEPDVDQNYYIDDFVFDDDRLLTAKRRKDLENRGGSGVIRFVQKEELHIGERNIILGLNIPEYQNSEDKKNISGRNVGENIISFTPYHAWGPDINTKTCPVCKYGWYHGILYFVGNNPNWEDIKSWLQYLETESIKREKYLKAYFIYGNEKEYTKELRDRELKKIGEELKLEKVALTFVPSFSDKQSEINFNNINPDIQNTFLVYKRSNVVDKFINLQPTQNNFELISNRLDETINEFFDLPKPKKE
jgi:protocatechuate 3,4-dioxygenase beta subunit